MREVGHGLHLRAAGGSEIALVLHDLERRGRAELVLSLVGAERLLLEDSGLDGRVVAGAGLLKADYRVLHVQTHLVDVFSEIQLILA